ncbi:MAG: hypothetical protein HC905_32145 [Bacteroidales bacterium]|nr:hypothetical protein [Bacteroidales bacterium]
MNRFAKNQTGILIIVFSLNFILQIGFTQSNKPQFISFSIENGLPGTVVKSICQDSTGFIWIATDNGISRYDGKRFTNYSFEIDDSNSIPSNVINKFFISREGKLWIGTNNGLCYYEPVNDNFIRIIPYQNLERNNPMNIITGIDEDNDGNIYFLVETGRLFKLENNHPVMKLNIQQETCKVMEIDDQNICWIGAGEILYKFDFQNNLTSQYRIVTSDITTVPEIWDLVFDGDLIYVAMLKNDIIRLKHKNRRINKIRIVKKSPKCYMFL